MKTPSQIREAIAKSVYERRLSPEEFERRLAELRNPIDDAERLTLMRWFQKRYPTAQSRLDYVRQRAQAWKPSR